MITNIYEFYLEDNKDKPKNELQEVTQVDSHIDVELDTPEIQLSDSPSIGVEIKDSSIISNDSIDISNITKSSVELGKESADFIISLIKPAIARASDSIANEVESILDKPTSTVAKITEGDIEDNDPISKIVDEYKIDIQDLIIEATKEVINRNTIDSSILSDITLTKNKDNSNGSINDSSILSDIKLINDDSDNPSNSFSLSDIKLVNNNDIAKDSFEQELRRSLINELRNSLSRIADKFSNSGSSISNEIKRIESDIINTTLDTINNITNSVLVPIMKVIDTVLIDLSTRSLDIGSRVISDVETSTQEIIQDLSEQVTGIINRYVDNFYRVFSQGSHELINKGRNWVREHVNDIINEKFSKLRCIDADGMLDRLRGVSSDKIPNLKRLGKIPIFMENNWRYLRNWTHPRHPIDYKYYRFNTTFDWLIKIRPINKQLPNLNSLLGISDDEFLPITSYNLTEAGLDSMSYQVLTNTIIVPQRYRRPSKLTITLPDIYVGESMHVNLENEGRTYLRKFKEEFIDYVKMVVNYPKYSLVSRDYRDCCYEITLYRFPYMATLDNDIDKVTFCKTYLGIPEISINESGNESKQLVTDTLIFNIVGEVT